MGRKKPQHSTDTKLAGTFPSPGMEELRDQPTQINPDSQEGKKTTKLVQERQPGCLRDKKNPLNIPKERKQSSHGKNGENQAWDSKPPWEGSQPPRSPQQGLLTSSSR